MLKPISIMILVISMAMVAPCYANQWAITYGGNNFDHPRIVRQTLDEGFIMSGYTYSFGAGSDDLLIVKLHQDGTIAWQKTYGGISSDGQGEITLKEDGGYFLTAETQTFGAGSADYWVFSLNSDGTIIWQKTFGGLDTDWNVPVGQQTSDGGYIVTGGTFSFGAGSEDVWILKLDTTGSIEWEKTYGGSGRDQGNDIIQTLDGGYIVVGSTNSFGAGSWDYWILKLNKNGSVVWQKTYGGTGDDRAHVIRHTTDGGYIVAGNARSFGAGSADIWLLKLSNNGSVEWQKSYGGVNEEIPDRAVLQETSDGGYILGGNTRSFGAGENDILLLKLNENGEVNWQKTYGESGNDEARSVQQILDGGYIISGFTDSFGAGSSDGLVLKLDENGDIPGCEYISDVSVTVTNTNAIVQDTKVVPQDSSATVTDTNVVPQDTNIEPEMICYYSVQLPTVPGFEVQTYTTVSGPVNLSFDPSGILYAGNGNDPSKIYRIEVGGSPVRGYGDDPLFDPDAVAFDVSGAVSGQPGSVLVGGIDGPGSPTGYLAAILPDESIKTIFGPTSGLINPQDILFDNEGRLLLADAFAGTVFSTSDGDTLNSLFPETLANELAVDADGNIYTGTPSGITIHSSDGSLLVDSFVTGLDIVGMDFGPTTPPWNGHLFSTSRDGDLFRIDDLGTVTKIGTGFGSPPNAQDVKFGPDEAMYVSDFENNVIYRIVPKALMTINDFVTFEPDPSTYDFNPDSTDCQAGAVGKFTFDATLTNISEKELSDLLVEVIELANNNLLLTDIGLIGEGGRFEVPKIDDYADGYLCADEYVDVPFTVCLQEKSPFRFFVNVLGVTEDIDLEKGLVASYPFNGNANDESGNGNTGTVHGATLTEDRFGNPNSAYKFGENNVYIVIPDDSIPVLTSLTQTVWFKTMGNPYTGGGGFNRLIDRYPTDQALLAVRPNIYQNRLSYFWVNNPSGWIITAPIIDNTWYHAALTYDGSTFKLYLNGNLLNQSSCFFCTTDGMIYIGIRGINMIEEFGGIIDDIRFYNRALSPAEIKALFNLGE